MIIRLVKDQNGNHVIQKVCNIELTAWLKPPTPVTKHLNGIFKGSYTNKPLCEVPAPTQLKIEQLDS